MKFNKTKIAKVFDKEKAVKASFMEETIDNVFAGVDVLAEAKERTGLQPTAMQPILLQGYVFDGDAGITEIKGGKLASTRYQKAVLMFSDSKMAVYSVTLSLIDDSETTYYAEFMLKDVLSLAISTEKRYYADEKKKKGKGRLIEENYLEVNAGKTFRLPLDGVESFADRPVLDEMRKFIESKKR